MFYFSYFFHNRSVLEHFFSKENSDLCHHEFENSNFSGDGEYPHPS